MKAVLADRSPEGLLNGELELVSDARLTVEADDTGGTPDLCSPAVKGGYLGAENQSHPSFKLSQPAFLRQDSIIPRRSTG